MENLFEEVKEKSRRVEQDSQRELSDVRERFQRKAGTVASQHEA